MKYENKILCLGKSSVTSNQCFIWVSSACNSSHKKKKLFTPPYAHAPTHLFVALHWPCWSSGVGALQKLRFLGGRSPKNAYPSVQRFFFRDNMPRNTVSNGCANTSIKNISPCLRSHTQNDNESAILVVHQFSIYQLPQDDDSDPFYLNSSLHREDLCS